MAIRSDVNFSRLSQFLLLIWSGFQYLRAKRREQRSNYHVAYHFPFFRASFSFCCVELKKDICRKDLNTTKSFLESSHTRFIDLLCRNLGEISSLLFTWNQTFQVQLFLLNRSASWCTNYFFKNSIKWDIKWCQGRVPPCPLLVEVRLVCLNLSELTFNNKIIIFSYNKSVSILVEKSVRRTESLLSLVLILLQMKKRKVVQALRFQWTVLWKYKSK